MKDILWYLLLGSRGGECRARIINSMHETPKNINAISRELRLDYKSVLHHIRMLEKHGIIGAINKGNYGAAYFISENYRNSELIREIWERFGKK